MAIANAVRFWLNMRFGEWDGKVERSWEGKSEVRGKGRWVEFGKGKRMAFGRILSRWVFHAHFFEILSLSHP